SLVDPRRTPPRADAKGSSASSQSAAVRNLRALAVAGDENTAPAWSDSRRRYYSPRTVADIVRAARWNARDLVLHNHAVKASSAATFASTCLRWRSHIDR